MGKFEDNIKKKFNVASFSKDGSSWNSFEKKWDQTQMNDLLFTQKVVNSMQFSLLPYAPGHWAEMNVKLDELEKESFENRFKSKMEEASLSGSILGWDKMEAKLSNSNVDVFDSKVGSKLNEGEVPYESKHWTALLKKLKANQRKKITSVVLGVLAMVGGFGAVVFGVQEVELTSEAKVEGLGANKSEEMTRGDQSVVKTRAQVTEVDNAGVVIEGEKEKGVNRKQENSTRSKEGQSELENEESVLKEVSLTKSGKVLGTERGEHLVSAKKDGGPVNEGVSTRMNPDDKDDVFEGAVLSSADFQTLLENYKKGVAKVSTEERRSMQPVTIGSMSSQEIAVSTPELSKFDSEVQIKKKKDATASLHAGLLPVLSFFDNSALTGLFGSKRLSVFGNEEWRTYSQYGKYVEFEFNRPLVVMSGFEYKLGSSSWNVGGFVQGKKSDNWNCLKFNASSAYEKSYEGYMFRFGVGLNYNRNKLIGGDLLFKESDLNSNKYIINEQQLSTNEIAADQFVTMDLGVMLSNEHYLVSYQLSNPLMFRIKYNSDIELVHNAVIAVHVLGNSFKTSGIVKYRYEGGSVFTPGLSIAYQDTWFGMIDYENFDRFNLNLGRQFSNGMSAYVTYGAVVDLELESMIRHVHSKRGHVAFGFNYLIK